MPPGPTVKVQSENVCPCRAASWTNGGCEAAQCVCRVPGAVVWDVRMCFPDETTEPKPSVGDNPRLPRRLCTRARRQGSLWVHDILSCVPPSLALMASAGPVVRVVELEQPGYGAAWVRGASPCCLFCPLLIPGAHLKQAMGLEKASVFLLPPSNFSGTT